MSPTTILALLNWSVNSGNSRSGRDNSISARRSWRLTSPTGLSVCPILTLTDSLVAPILVHDIKLVPQDHQRNAGLMYKYWLVLLVTLIVNFLACLFDFFGSGSM